MQEAETVSARKATLFNRKEDDDRVQVQRRRLFKSIDDSRASGIVSAYRARWSANRNRTGSIAGQPETVDTFLASHPLHPEVLERLTGKTATLSKFERVRGMLRLLARSVGHFWQQRPSAAAAIHIHHIDPGYEPIRQGIVTRSGQSAYLPAITHDVGSGGGSKKFPAESVDGEDHTGMPRYAYYVAHSVFMHTLAFHPPLQGVTLDHLRFAILGPATDISFNEEARKRFVEDRSDLDDRPGAPLRISVEANVC